VIDSGWLAHGPKNKEFEAMFAEFVGAKHAVAMNSCTSALHLAVECLGITGEVILPSFTWVASANAVVTGGGIPVFADIVEDTRCLDVNSVESMVGPHTEAIMVVHYGGQTADMTAIMALAEKHGLAIIEDSAETIGGTHSGTQAGAFGIGCFSFFPTKNITVGEGGMLTTSDDEIVTKVRRLVGHGVDKTTYEREREGKPWLRAASAVGYNFRLTNFQSAMGIIQMAKIHEMNEKRRKLAEMYRERLSDCSNIDLPQERPENTHVYQMYTILVKDAARRDALVCSLQRMKIGASVHFYPPVHRMKPYQARGSKCSDMTVTEKVCASIVTLPMYPGMSEEDVDYVSTAVQKFFK
jgi:perosamine synthetase